MMCRYLFSLLQCVKRVWAYLKEHKLMDPENKQWFTPDKTMAPIFGEEKIKAFGMLKYLKVSAMLRDPNSVVRGFLFTEPPVSDACQRTQAVSPQFLVVKSQFRTYVPFLIFVNTEYYIITQYIFWC